MKKKEKPLFIHCKSCRITLLVFVWLLPLVSVYATPHNIATRAQVKASSFIPGFEPEKIIDGAIRLYDQREWRSQSKETFWGYIDYPWIELKWDEAQPIERIILYDRPNPQSQIAGVTIHFSDHSKIYVNSIPNDGAPKVIDFPTKLSSFIRIESTDAMGTNVGLSEVEVYPSIEGYHDFVEKVDPYIETARGRYFFFVTGSLPFGMISAAPMTRNKNQYGGGYNYNSKEILGFPQLHDWMNGGIVLMPTTGEVPTKQGEEGWKSSFSHEGETVRPGYHKLFLDRYNLWVEQTATDRVSFYRFTYCNDAPLADILLNLGGYVGTITMTEANIQKVSDQEIEGSVNTMGRLWGGPDNVKVYYVMQFSKPMKAIDGWDNQTEYRNIESLTSHEKPTRRNATDMTYWDAPSSGIKARFTAKTGEQICVKVAISYTSIANARLNMEMDCNHWDFDAVHQQSQKEWNDYLGKIAVKGGTRDQQIKFYTDLWHVLLGRHKIDDYSGDYPDYTQGERQGKHTVNAVFKKRTLPKDANGKVKFHMYNSDAFWLSQWNLNVLWGLAWPEVLDDFSACLVQYAENGGLLPRGPNLGGYSYIMSSCPATNLLTAAYQKDMLTKTTPTAAYKAMVNNHKGGGMLGSKEQIDFYEQNGYFPDNAGWTIEAAFQDWALSQMAGKLRKKKDAAFYLKRSQGWENLFCDKVNLLMPKNNKGEWLHQDPLSGEGWIEANAWQATWGISHGLSRLAELMGGKDALCTKLNEAFERSKEDDFVYGYRDGYVSYANQPGCSNAHVFNRAGRPDLAQYWVRRVNEQAYGATTPDKGYGGHDEDQGQMGGVSALMSIGMFSVDGTCSIQPVYDITSPVFDEITIRLDKKYYPNGDKFIIKCHNNSKENCYIERIALNGKELSECLLPHKEYAKGGILELWLSNSAPVK